MYDFFDNHYDLIRSVFLYLLTIFFFIDTILIVKIRKSDKTFHYWYLNIFNKKEISLQTLIKVLFLLFLIHLMFEPVGSRLSSFFLLSFYYICVLKSIFIVLTKNSEMR